MVPYTVPEIQSVLKTICTDSRIKRVILFGSYAKGAAHHQSDIDLYLDSGQQITGFDFFELKAKLEDAFQIPIDLLPDRNIIPGSPVEREIMAHGVTVYDQQ
jgi:predicted nucleotidyltransferase